MDKTTNPPSSKIASEDSILNGMAFKPRPSDVFITTYPKCGTTWISQVCQVLRSNGDMNFEEIGEVVPWDMLAKDCNQDLDDDQVYSPRLFKSHFYWDKIGKGGKYIHVVRNPVAVLQSFYLFLLGFRHLTPDDLPFTQFFEEMFMKNVTGFGTVFDFYASYLKADNQANILWVFYENLQENPAYEIERIGRFMELDKLLTPQEFMQRCELAKVMSSKEFMIENDSKFNGSFVFNNIKKAIIGDRSDKLTKPAVSKVNNKKKESLTAEMKSALEQAWTETVARQFGFITYEDMRKKLSS